MLQALYEGYCLDPTAAKQYVALFHADREPYSTDCLRANSEQLANLVRSTAANAAPAAGRNIHPLRKCVRQMLYLVLVFLSTITPAQMHALLSAGVAKVTHGFMAAALSLWSTGTGAMHAISCSS